MASLRPKVLIKDRPQVVPRDYEVRASEHDELVRQGWERRFLADPARAEEATELYTALGLEVRAVGLRPENFAGKCGDCPDLVCRQHVLIYTRAGAQSTSGREPPRT